PLAIAGFGSQLPSPSSQRTQTSSQRTQTSSQRTQTSSQRTLEAPFNSRRLIIHSASRENGSPALAGDDDEGRAGFLSTPPRHRLPVPPPQVHTAQRKLRGRTPRRSHN